MFEPGSKASALAEVTASAKISVVEASMLTDVEPWARFTVSPLDTSTPLAKKLESEVS